MQPGKPNLSQSAPERVGDACPVNQSAYTQRYSHKHVNVGHVERAVFTLGGGLLALKGLRKGGLSGIALAIAGVVLTRRGITGHCNFYERFDIDTNRQRPARPEDYFNRGIHVEESVTIQASVARVFEFWRNFANLARFMGHVKNVQVLDDRRSHWVVEGPGGTVEWDAEIINEEPERLIAWRSLPGSEINNTGSVQFRAAPHGRGTEVRVVLEYLPPAGRLGLAIATLLGKTPGAQIRDDLRRLRQLIEAGEVPTTEGQPTGRARLKGRLKTAAIAGVTRMMGRPDKPVRFARNRAGKPDSDFDLGLPPRLGAEDHGGTPAGQHNHEPRSTNLRRNEKEASQ